VSRLPNAPQIAEKMPQLDLAEAQINSWITRQLAANSKAFAFFTDDLSVLMIDSYARSPID